MMARILKCAAMHKPLIVGWFAVVVTGCDNGFCNDSEGLGPGLIVLRNDGFVIPTVYGALGSTPERVFPYDEESPFLKCRAIGTLSFRHPDAVLDSDHYPALESLGYITVELDDSGGDPIIADVPGFDGVIAFGGIGNPIGRSDAASIRRVSGFNSVEHVTGSLLTVAVLNGFASLRQVDGNLFVRGMETPQTVERVGGLRLGAWRSVGLDNLQEITGDLSIEASQLTEIGFPSLTHVGGNVDILSNDYLERWTGMAPRAEIGGHFLARNNNPVRDEVFEQWLIDSETVVAGETKICGNRPIDEPVGEEICTGL
jgi:hypothetical protein